MGWSSDGCPRSTPISILIFTFRSRPNRGRAESFPTTTASRKDIDENEGASAFYRDKKSDIYHTYSTYERGIDLMNTTYNFLDLTAKGRDEKPGTHKIGCVITTNTGRASNECCA